MTLGARIKMHRQNAGLSQEAVADLVGVSRQAVTKWERDQTAPSMGNLLRLAEILGTTVPQLASDDSGPDQLTAQEVSRLLQAEQDRRAQKRHSELKRNLCFALLTAGGYLLVYLLGKLLTGSPQSSSFLGWLLGCDSTSYLFGWLLSSKLFWMAMLVSTLPALWGKIYFSLTTWAAFSIGIPVGELLGPYPAGAAFGHGHYGWAIWGGIFLVSAAMGILLERIAARESSLCSRKGAVWLAAWLGCCLLVTLFLLLSRPEFS